MKILFVCHGNICRSPMAEFVMKDMLAKAGRDDVAVESAALHTDEIGSDIHHGTRSELTRHGVPFSPHHAWLLTTDKVREYDLVIGMDGANMRDLKRIADQADAPKLRRLLDFAGIDRDVADPWYTGDFEATYADVVAGCSALLETLQLSKDEIRRKMRARRKALSADERAEASAVICAKLARRVDLGSLVAVYLASPDEIDLRAYIERLLSSGCKVVAPRWNGGTYELAVLKGLDARHLRRGPMGIMEPVDAEIVPAKEVYGWIVPGLAFTRDGRRLGYGGGWYDRLLADAPKDAVKLGVAYSFQIVDDLPAKPHDIRLAAVVDDTPAWAGILI